jgi:hypothetical protein
MSEVTMSVPFPGCRIGDLEENRRGRVRREHALRVVRREIVMGLAGLAASSVWMLFAVNSGVGLLGLLAIAAACVTAYKLMVLAIDIVQARVFDLEGLVRKRVDTDAESPDKHFLIIAGCKLHVTRAGFDSVPEGERCRIYALPLSRWVVNCEVLVEL